MLDFPRKSLVNHKRHVNTYLALNKNWCYYYFNESVILNNWIIRIDFFGKPTLFISIINKNHVKKDKKRPKNQNKIYKYAKNRIK